MGKISAKVPAGGASLAAQKRVSESNAKEVAQSESIQKSAQSPHKISAYENQQGSARFRSLSETSPKNFAAFLINSKSSLSGEEGAFMHRRCAALY